MYLFIVSGLVLLENPQSFWIRNTACDAILAQLLHRIDEFWATLQVILILAGTLGDGAVLRGDVGTPVPTSLGGVSLNTCQVSCQRVQYL